MSYSQREFAEKVARLGHRCVFCGSFVDNRKSSQALVDRQHKLVVEHEIPTARGGSDEISNIFPACAQCNLMKGNKTAQEFIASRPELCKFAIINRSFLIQSKRPARITTTSEVIVLERDEFCPFHPGSGLTIWKTCWDCYVIRCQRATERAWAGESRKYA